MRNERHCGAVRARKTFTPNYLNHKSRKNRGDRLSYFAEEHHEPIIAPEDYFAVQKLLSNTKYGGRGILPELHAVADGALRGFVAVNPRWAGFEAADYREASLRVCESSVALEPVKIEAHPGDFDLREFEVVRAQFFQTVSMPCVTLSAKGIHFNHVCVQKLNKAKLVEVLVHPGKKAVAVRPAEEKLRHGLCWVRLAGNSRWISRTVSGAAFIPTLYQLFGWNAEYKYCVKGICCRNSEESILLFHWEDAEILIPDSVIGDTGRRLLRSAARRAVAAFPVSWADTLGNSWYVPDRTQETMEGHRSGQFMIPAEPPAGGRDRNYTESSVIADSIQRLIPQVQQEVEANGG